MLYSHISFQYQFFYFSEQLTSESLYYISNRYWDWDKRVILSIHAVYTVRTYNVLEIYIELRPSATSLVMTVQFSN
jgi:hypothetical protein